MKTEQEIKNYFDEIVGDIEIAEKQNQPLRVAGLFRTAMALSWVLDKEK